MWAAVIASTTRHAVVQQTRRSERRFGAGRWSLLLATLIVVVSIAPRAQSTGLVSLQEISEFVSYPSDFEIFEDRLYVSNTCYSGGSGCSATGASIAVYDITPATGLLAYSHSIPTLHWLTEIAIDPHTRRLFAAAYTPGAVHMIDLPAGGSRDYVTHTLPLKPYAYGIDVDPTSGKVYVTFHLNGGLLAVIRDQSERCWVARDPDCVTWLSTNAASTERVIVNRRTQQIIVTNNHQGISIFDGKPAIPVLLNTVPIGLVPGPGGIPAIDENTGRVFLSSGYGFGRLAIFDGTSCTAEAGCGSPRVFNSIELPGDGGAISILPRPGDESLVFVASTYHPGVLDVYDIYGNRLRRNALLQGRVLVQGRDQQSLSPLIYMLRFRSGLQVLEDESIAPRKPTAEIAWNPADLTYGQALGHSQLNAWSDVVGTFIYSLASGTVLPAGTHEMCADFTPVDLIQYDTSSHCASLTVHKAAAIIEVVSETVHFDGRPHAATVRATGPSKEPLHPITASYRNVASVLTTFEPPTAVGTYEVTASFSGDANHEAGEGIGTLRILAPVNEPPRLTAGGPYWAYAGSPVFLHASADDPDGDVVSIEWDLDGDGQFEASGPTQVATAAQTSASVPVRALDPQGGTTSGFVSIIVVTADPDPQPGPVDPYFAPRPPFMGWDPATGELRADYGPRFEPAQLATTCAVASNMLGQFPLWRVDSLEVFPFWSYQVSPNYQALVTLQRALPPAFKYVGMGYAVHCARLPIPGGAGLAASIGLETDCVSLRQLYTDLAGEKPEETLANALPIPEKLKELIRTRLVLCPFSFDLSGIECEEKIAIMTELAQLALPGLGVLLNSPVGKFIANSLLCGINIDLPQVDLVFPKINWGLGSPGCWFGCPGNDDGGQGPGGDNSGADGGIGPFYGESLPDFGQGEWDFRILPPQAPTGHGDYVDCAILPANWQAMTYAALQEHAVATGVPQLVMLDAFVACTAIDPVPGFPYRGDASLTMTGPSTVPVRDHATYLLSVASAGPGPAARSRVDLVSPVPFSVVSGNCTQPSPTTARCEVGDVAPGESRSVTIGVRFNEAASAVVHAGLVSYIAEADLTDNAASVETEITRLTPVISWAPADVTYGQPLGSQQLNATADVQGVFEYSYAAGTLLQAAQHELSVAFTPLDDRVYLGASATQSIIVHPAALTISVNGASREFGTPNPSFGAAFEGFVGGDDQSDLGGVLAFSTSATPLSPVGDYPVNVGGLSSVNYAITFVPGVLRIVDTTPPDISRVDPSMTTLWAPNHKMVPVTFSVLASDAASPFGCIVTAVGSNEPVYGTVNGDAGPDWQITGDLSVVLRAERSGRGRGRIYTIMIACRDRFDNVSSATTTVVVPRDQRR